MSNTITAFFKGRVGVSEAVYQNDYGIVMNFDSIELPAHFDCYFSVMGEDEAIPGIGADRQVVIPNSCLSKSGTVTLHIPIHSGTNDSEVEYIVYFKVIGRARPVDDGTPAQMTAIEQALALLQNPIGNIEQIVNEALAFTGDTFAEMQAQLDADQAAFKTEVRGDIADVESDFDNLNAQYQTAVAALTVDSEVQNVRVGADNVTYASAGEAVRTQFTNLKSDLSDINGIEFSVDNYFINVIGESSPNNSYHATDYILLCQDCAVGVRDCFAGTSSLGIAFYTAEKVFISGINNIDGSYEVSASSVPTNAKYVRFGSAKSSGGTTYNTNAYIINSVEISLKLKEINDHIDDVVIEPRNTTFFKIINEFDKHTAQFYTDRFIDSSGNISTTSSNVNTIVFPVKPNTKYYLYIPDANRNYAVESTDDDFRIGTTKTHLNVSGLSLISFTTGATTKYVGMFFYSGIYDYDSNIDNIVINEGSYAGNISPYIYYEHMPQEVKDKLDIVHPINTTFFDIINWFNPSEATWYSDRYIDFSGIVAAASNTNTLVVLVSPNTDYYVYIPNSNRGIIAESDTDSFNIGDSNTVIFSAGSGDSVMHFTTGANAKYVGIYFYSGAYDYDANKANIALNIGQYKGAVPPQIKKECIPASVTNPLDKANVLIFGDSITDCCNLTINASDETTAYVWRNPSNSYVDGGGTTVNFSMWAKILKESEPCGEIRNYAQYGASYKTASRQVGEERQNLQYQINVAMNDLDNPNNVFTVDDYVPDIVIFALGTNDGAPNDTYDSAMSKTVLKSDNISIDVDATISALDDTKFCESARKAYMRVKKAFPMAQIYVVLPIQRADSDMLSTNHDYLKQMAERYSCIIVDGAETTGITRDGNVWNGLGVYLKDGLHPNEKGQNLLARAIITSMKANYMPFGTGFNN